jgi:hypothetical protein
MERKQPVHYRPIWERTSLAYRQWQILNSSRTGFLRLALSPHLASGAADNKDGDGGGNGNSGSHGHGNNNDRWNTLVPR